MPHWPCASCAARATGALSCALPLKVRRSVCAIDQCNARVSGGNAWRTGRAPRGPPARACAATAVVEHCAVLQQPIGPLGAHSQVRRGQGDPQPLADMAARGALSARGNAHSTAQHSTAQHSTLSGVHPLQHAACNIKQNTDSRLAWPGGGAGQAGLLSGWCLCALSLALCASPCACPMLTADSLCLRACVRAPAQCQCIGANFDTAAACERRRRSHDVPACD